MAKKNVLTQSKKKKALALIQRHRLEEAKGLLGQVSQQDPADAEAWFLLGGLNGRLALPVEAVACLRKAIGLWPQHAPSYFNLGIALRDQRDYAGALAAFHAVLRIQPNYPEGHDCLAHAFMMLGQLDEAAAAFRAGLMLQPNNAEMHSNLGAVYQAQGYLEKAEVSYREAQRLKPGLAHDSLGSVLCKQGKYQEALACYRAGLQKNPQDHRCYSNLLMTLNYMPGLDPEAVFQEHRAWAGPLERSTPLPFTQALVAERRLRVGYVSPDFRTHSVAYFIEPLLRGHNRQEVEVFCYADISRPDTTTARLQSLADGWRDITGMGDGRVVELIHADRVDILVDLCGHTGGNRLPVFARRAAPVQVTYLGYPNTTGLAAMDYRFTDGFADPPGQERYYSEKLVRLPGCFLCYQPPADSPPISPLPMVSAGHITLGSFNNLSKMNPEVIALWSQLLLALPDAHLLLKNASLTDPAECERCYHMFAGHGLGRERISFMGHTPGQQEHLALYGRIDLALDTFPYNGTTTTLEALWMGVPVITLAGRCHAGRVGVSLLTAMGLSELIAESPEHYQDIVLRLASERDRLGVLRATLRERMHADGLCDHLAFARKIEGVYRDMWRLKCSVGFGQ